MLAGLAGTVASVALLRATPAWSQEAAEAEAPTPEPVADAPVPEPGEPFSFDWLTERVREASLVDPAPAEQVEGFLSDLTYDRYQMIQFRTDHTRWSDPGQRMRLQAFHLGWLFREPVHVFEVSDGRAQPLTFSTADFEYRGELEGEVPADAELPGVAGFRLLAALNRADHFDEVISFLGASYFRALGRGNVYGLSARGLAVNTGLSDSEEFPRFSDFWLERPQAGDGPVTVYARLESRSVTGAYRFVIAPGDTTEIEVTARIFLRRDVRQLGVAPLTSMFMFGGADPDESQDFRPAVHDSEYLVLNMRSGESNVRALNNPPRLASSYLGMESPLSFGLVQRSRAFEDYLDAEAHYERRPSLIVEPIGDWGQGTVRLIEIPSAFEGNDNIVAYWVPDRPTRRGDAFEVGYRLLWGAAPRGAVNTELAQVLRTRAGIAGVAGADVDPDMRKFVIDFKGGLLSELSAESEVEPDIGTGRGELVDAVLSKISGSDTWRLVLEVRAEPGTVVELRAALKGYDRTLSETWLYQWVRE
ncbi:glucan biosynthesis protein G [Rhodobacter sp. NTK016B]|uniref:glucan biosynthesis protein n=1 Tax=Rhodobacter sp. NTK016B TaxID=2759676 RepID=UPI001A8E5A67|nr:glucan biosynthesis protein G [Rhodobacter sp. NTK016B]MBN8292924.1 glucan biosynthesis protein G [Rhodobacter sp. NTK016B]